MTRDAGNGDIWLGPRIWETVESLHIAELRKLSQRLDKPFAIQGHQHEERGMYIKNIQKHIVWKKTCLCPRIWNSPSLMIHLFWNSSHLIFPRCFPTGGFLGNPIVFRSAVVKPNSPSKPPRLQTHPNLGCHPRSQQRDQQRHPEIRPVSESQDELKTSRHLKAFSGKWNEWDRDDWEIHL